MMKAVRIVVRLLEDLIMVWRMKCIFWTDLKDRNIEEAPRKAWRLAVRK